MDSTSQTGTSKRRGIRLAALGASVTAIGFPFAAAASVPTAIGYVSLPGVIIFSTMATACLVCFFLCPSRPLVPKLLTLALAGHALFWVLYSLGYYWLHLTYHA
jgi:hypothetical protein